MSLPSNVDLGFVSGTFTNGDGTPATGGKVTFKPKAAWVLDPTATPPTTILPSAVTVTLDANGQIPTTAAAVAAGKTGQHLIASLDHDISPTGWTWNASFAFVSGTRDAFDFTLDVSEQADLTTKGSAASSAGTVTGGILVGAGVTGLQVLTAAAYSALATPDQHTLYLITS